MKVKVMPICLDVYTRFRHGRVEEFKSDQMHGVASLNDIYVCVFNPPQMLNL